MASIPFRSRAQKHLEKAVKKAAFTMRRGDGGPFGAVIVYKNKVIAEASNTVLKSNDPTCHAEINAIRIAAHKIGRLKLTECDIYSTTEPCPMCFSAIHWAGISKVIYSTTIGQVKKLGFNELAVSNRLLKKWGKSPVKIVRLKSKECERLLENWKKMPEKMTY